VAEEEEYEVTIIGREEITVFPRLREAVRVKMVTYVAAGLPPATIEIPLEEYSLEREKELILEDIKRRLAFRPETYRVRG